MKKTPDAKLLARFTAPDAEQTDRDYDTPRGGQGEAHSRGMDGEPNCWGAELIVRAREESCYYDGALIGK